MTRRTLLSMPLAGTLAGAAPQLRVEVEQLTHGPKHHFFGYIGHVRNTPWSGDDRYLALLRTGFQDHMPAPEEAAEVVLVDTRRRNAVTVIDKSRAWNPQQGTMLYWNPKRASRQLVFNDRDPKTNRVFPVLFDIAKQKRVREYRYDDTPFGNSGVAQNGGYFLGINYGRMARLRPVTGYPAACDWTVGEAAPDNDGIFLVEIDSAKKRLLVSFRQLAELLRGKRPDIDTKHLFINHTLWNRQDNRIYFYVRADFEARQGKVDVPCIIRPDGTGLTMLGQFVGGHPEWEFGSHMIGCAGGRQIVYDVDKQMVVGHIGTPEILPQPCGDGALSADGKWFASGFRIRRENFYAILNRQNGSHVRSRGFPVDGWLGGELRLDPAPCWNRSSNAIAIPALAPDSARTRQTFLLRIRTI